MSTESVNLPSRNSLRASRPHTAQVIVFATICYSESPATIALPRNSRTALSLGAGGKHDLRRGDEQRLRVVLQDLNVGERGYGRARRLAPLLRLPLALYNGQLRSQAPESGECRRSEHCARL